MPPVRKWLAPVLNADTRAEIDGVVVWAESVQQARRLARLPYIGAGYDSPAFAMGQPYPET